jgi:hypothetical protein
MSSLTADILSKSLIELLEMCESNGPGLISIPDIINKMQRTMKKLRHLRTKMLLLVFTCNLCISGQQSDLPFFPIHSKHWYNLMGIEVDQYRESIGKYYTVARSVKKGKLLSITDIACFSTCVFQDSKVIYLPCLYFFWSLLLCKRNALILIMV